MSYPDEDLKGSVVRLWHLIEERLKPGADREKVDRRIWDCSASAGA